MLICVDETGPGHWSIGGIQNGPYISPLAVTDLPVSMVVKLPGPFLNYSQLGRWHFNYRSLLVTKYELCTVTVGGLLLIECKLCFQISVNMTFFKTVETSSIVENDKLSGNKGIIQKGNCSMVLPPSFGMSRFFSRFLK